MYLSNNQSNVIEKGFNRRWEKVLEASHRVEPRLNVSSSPQNKNKNKNKTKQCKQNIEL